MTLILDAKSALPVVLAMKFDEVATWDKVPSRTFRFGEDGGMSSRPTGYAYICTGFTEPVAVPMEDVPQDSIPVLVRDLQICRMSGSNVSIHSFNARCIETDHENRVFVFRAENTECL